MLPKLSQFERCCLNCRYSHEESWGLLCWAEKEPPLVPPSCVCDNWKPNADNESAGGVTYGDIYQLGYDDAIDDMRKYLQHVFKGDKSDPVSYSFNSGWNQAIDKVIQDSFRWGKSIG